MFAQRESTSTTARVLIDIKPTRSGVFPDSALQVVAYAEAETMLEADGVTAAPMPSVDFVAVLHVRGDGYDLFPMATGEGERERCFRMFLYAQQIARFFKRDGPADQLVGPSIMPTAHKEARSE